MSSTPASAKCTEPSIVIVGGPSTSVGLSSLMGGGSLGRLVAVRRARVMFAGWIERHAVSASLADAKRRSRFAIERALEEPLDA